MMKNLLLLLLVILFSCDEKKVNLKKEVYPDNLQSIRKQDQILLTWESPLIYMNVSPGFSDYYAMPDSYEIYLSENDTLQFKSVAHISGGDNSYLFPENKRGKNYYFKLKCIAKDAISAYTNMIWVNGGENPELESYISVPYDYTLKLGDISSDSKLLIYSRNVTKTCCKKTHVMSFNISTGEETLIIEESRIPVYSQDNNMIAFISSFNVDESPQPKNLGIIDLTSKEVTQITDGQNIIWYPLFSADGKFIYYLRTNSEFSDPYAIYQYSIENKEITVLVSGEQKVGNGPMSFLEKEQLLAFRKDNGIYVYDFNTKEIRSFEQSIWGEYNPAFSADGNYLAFISLRSGRPEIWVKYLLTNTYSQITGSAQGYPKGKLLWINDSHKIIFRGKYENKNGIFPIDFKP